MSDAAIPTPVIPGVVTGPPQAPLDATPYIYGSCPDCGAGLRGIEMMQHFGAVDVGRGRTANVPVCGTCAEKRFKKLEREVARSGSGTTTAT